ncbi:MAG TPA: hypothetical protein VF755_09630 [Catenuloplanes sp.]|jgi:hypothetical protein
MSTGINFEDRLLRELHEQLAERPVAAVARPMPRRPVRRWVLAGGFSAAAVATVAMLPLLTQPGPAYAIAKQPDGSFVVVLHSRTPQDIERVEREMKRRGVRVELIALGAQCGTMRGGMSPPSLPPGTNPGPPLQSTPGATGSPLVTPTGTPPTGTPPTGSSPTGSPPTTRPGAAVPVLPASPPSSRPVPEADAFGPYQLTDGRNDDLAFRVNPAGFPAGQVLWVAVFDRPPPSVTGPIKFLAFRFADVGQPAPNLC